MSTLTTARALNFISLLLRHSGPCLAVSTRCGREQCLCGSSAKLGWVLSAAIVQGSLCFLHLEVVLSK